MAAKDDWDLFGQVAEMLGLDEEESENFVTSAMRRRGHKPKIQWDDNEEGGEKSGDFFTKKRESRQVGGRQQRGSGRERESGGGWQYG
jgi:hypothetical protein